MGHLSSRLGLWFADFRKARHLGNIENVKARLLKGHVGPPGRHEFDATFDYEECAGQFFHFDGGDGAWLFVDGELVMDLGGVAPGTDQYVDFDRLGLTDGENYRLEFFYAQRTAGRSVFRLRTNLDLTTEPTATVSAPFD